MEIADIMVNSCTIFHCRKSQTPDLRQTMQRDKSLVKIRLSYRSMCAA